MATGMEAFLDALPPESRELVLALRNRVRRSVPDAEESLPWGSLSYHPPQGGLLRGDGVSKRFVPIGAVAVAERPGVTALVRQAAALDPAEWA
jgi:hypothetical protein